MISRRILRIKILQALYSHFKSSKSFADSEKELQFSIHKSTDLFYYLLRLIIDIKSYAISVIERNQNKARPTPEDINPNMKFVNNKLIQQIEDNQQLNKKLDTTKLSWVQYPEFIRSLYQLIIETPEYKEYMNDPSKSYQQDKKIVIDIFSKYIIDFDNLYSNLEEQSIFWNSEIDFIISIIVRLLKSFNENDTPSKIIINDEFDEDDKEFIKILFRKTIVNYETYKELIDQYTKNWDVERIAFMDIIIMQMAINEIIEMPSIPIKVSFNEYIDIAKFFSTQQSGQFINGILDKIIERLDKEKKIVKKGRGLKENL